MTDDIFQRLAAPFPADRVSWRVGSTTADKTKGMALAYIDARDVMERLDEVCGPSGWQNRYPHANGKTVCEVGLKIGDEWIWKADGAGDTDYEAEKGALSDAFKRAAVRWGIGRYLYDLSPPWVEVEARGKTFIIKQDQHAKLRALLSKDAAKPAPTRAEAPAATGASVMSLSERATILENVMRSVKTPDDLRKAYAKGSKVCAELDTADPERLVEINDLYAKLFDELSERVAA